MLKLLKAHGWQVDRINGSHHQLIHPNHPATVTVPVHSKKELGKGLEKIILKQAGLK